MNTTAKLGDSTLGLGIKSVNLSPNGLYVVATQFDTKIKLFNGISMKEIANLEHQTQLNLKIPELSSVIVYREESVRDNLMPGSDRFIS